MKISLSQAHLILITLLIGCAVPSVSYQPKSRLNINDAKSTLVTLFDKTREEKWEGVFIKKKVTPPPVVISDEFVEIPDGHDRIYFKSIDKVTIYDNGATSLGAYRVYVSGSDKSQYVFRTNEMQDAEQFVDALDSLMFEAKSKSSNSIKPSSTTTSPNEEKLIELQSLKNKGLINEDEYQIKKKQLLEKM